MEESAIKQFHAEALNKEERGLVKIVDWEHIKNLPDHLFPQALKSSPLSAVTHKSRGWRAILDLSWSLQWEKGEIPSVNENTTKTAPRGSVDQIGHALQRIIHAIATAPSGEKVFLAKWDVQDGFWQMVCEKGAEWNFCYVLPQEAGKPIKLVVPTALQMGWLESPGFFGAASETARDVIQSYVQAPIGTLPTHKFEHYTQAHDDYKALPDTSSNDDDLLFNFDVFVDDFIGLACAKSKRQLDHVGRGALHGIHDVFPPADDEDKDANSVKKMKKLDGAWALNKDALGFEFDGDDRTIILDKTKRDKIVGQLSLWTKKTRKKKRHETTAIPFEEFKTLVHQLRHAATCLPTGKSLLSELNREVCIEGRRFIYVRVGSLLYQELDGWKKLLIAATLHPTPCAELVSGHPDGIGIVDAASTEGVGGVVVGENDAMVPTVFRMDWPDEVKALVISQKNPHGKISISDLECAGLLILWFVMEQVAPSLALKHFALLNDNTPTTVSWGKKLNTSKSKTAAALLRVLALRLKMAKASPLIPMHIPGEENGLSDIPSRSFGGKAKWHCKTDDEFLTLFNNSFPLPNQNSWTLFHLPKDISSGVISILLTQASELGEWRRPQSAKKSSGNPGVAIPKLWEWTLSCRRIPLNTHGPSGPSQVLQQESKLATSVTDAKLLLARSLRLSQPLARRYPWSKETTP